MALLEPTPWYTIPDESGEDADGNPLPPLAKWWEDEKIAEKWYKVAMGYWSDRQPTVDDMLGGFGSISDTDIAGSADFIRPLLQKKCSAIDVGAGIGRIGSTLLKEKLGFEQVDLLEQEMSFLKATQLKSASAALITDKTQSSNEKTAPEEVFRNLYCFPFQNFDFESNGLTYDLIWIQWCIIYLTDADFVTMLRRAASVLAPNGVLVIKDNISSTNKFYIDEQDYSITRTDNHLKVIFGGAGLKVKAEKIQTGFPKGLLPVKMYALVKASE